MEAEDLKLKLANLKRCWNTDLGAQEMPQVVLPAATTALNVLILASF